MIDDEDIPSWPTGFYELDESLPAISYDQGLAILERFLHLEHRRLVPGSQMHALHWDVLTAQYAPLQERYDVIKSMVGSGILTQAASGRLHGASGLRWPLTISQAGITAIRKERLQARLPFFRKIENALSDINEAYPHTLRVLFWLLIGGGIGQLLESVIAWLK
ncbi:MAG: hypothetical protein ACREXY_26735 [Gammaproteobacteria bacterium]